MRQGLRQKNRHLCAAFWKPECFRRIFVRRILVGSFVYPCRHGNLHRTFPAHNRDYRQKSPSNCPQVRQLSAKTESAVLFPAADNRHSGNLIAVHRINAFTLSALTRATMLLDSILETQQRIYHIGIFAFSRQNGKLDIIGIKFRQNCSGIEHADNQTFPAVFGSIIFDPAEIFDFAVGKSHHCGFSSSDIFPPRRLTAISRARSTRSAKASRCCPTACQDE